MGQLDVENGTENPEGTRARSGDQLISQSLVKLASVERDVILGASDEIT